MYTTTKVENITFLFSNNVAVKTRTLSAYSMRFKILFVLFIFAVVIGLAASRFCTDIDFAKQCIGICSDCEKVSCEHHECRCHPKECPDNHCHSGCHCHQGHCRAH